MNAHGPESPAVSREEAREMGGGDPRDTRLDAFLLTRRFRDGPHGLTYTFWGASEQGPVRVKVTGEEPVFFVRRDTAVPRAARRRAVALRGLDGPDVDAVYFRRRSDLFAARDALLAAGHMPYESDVKPVDRFLMERFITGGMTITGRATSRDGFLEFLDPVLHQSNYVPQLRVVALDIETQGLTGPLYSIAVAGAGGERVFMRGAGDDTDTVRFFPDERAVIGAFLAWVRDHDPDLLLGWNVVNFDLNYLQRKCVELRMPFALGRSGETARVSLAQESGQFDFADVPGRVVLDGIATLRTATYAFESFSLENVARELLGRGKRIQESAADKVAEINRLFHEDPRALAEYNLEDCRLVLAIFEKADLIRFAVERARLTGLAMNRQGGSVAAFDFLYLPRLHRHGYVAPDIPADPVPDPSPGGYVMDSKPGLYENVLVLDFKSLYPSIIRTFHIDPLALAVPGDDPIAGFHGALFSRSRHILPGIIETLWAARDEAKRRGNQAHSQAIKIIMNSFYGVLGTPRCRFFSSRLAGSITRYGHELITRSKAFIEDRGYPVIYGDTDSLFVLLGPNHDRRAAHGIGEGLAASLNEWWRDTLRKEHRVESCLEIEFETHYRKFLMPTIRGSEKGTKKRYAGLVEKPGGRPVIVFKGLESVRGDWTPLARSFQRELYRRVFLGEPYEDYVRTLAGEVLAGKRDDELVYQKRLRRELSDYAKHVPPHVRAARQLEKPGSHIRYFITIHGPQAEEKRESPLDYAHYLDHQLAPAADGLLHFLGTSFAKLTDPQLKMFDEES